MTRLKLKPRFSLIFSLLLLLLTYSAEGWLYCSWIHQFVIEKNLLPYLTIPNRISLFYGIAAIVIMLVVVIFTSPVSLVTVGLNRWLKSDTRAFLSIFIGAFTFAMIVQRVDIFARFLVMVSAVFLGKLDFQLMGCSRWLCSFILVILCWLGFTGGILAFYRWNF
ncbi:MAG: hypothetical protein AAF652_18580 [Cyanobacteria bacterium P01_C01_bin.72]